MLRISNRGVSTVQSLSSNITKRSLSTLVYPMTNLTTNWPMDSSNHANHRYINKSRNNYNFLSPSATFSPSAPSQRFKSTIDISSIQKFEKRNSVDFVRQLDLLRQIEKKLIWLSTYTIHNANVLREKRDGLKVGGHQSSSTSLATIMTALYFHSLRPQDRIAVKPHASPIFHSIQYLMGKQDVSQMQNFRGFQGMQSYPSRTKDKKTLDIDFSTGSVGLGAAITSFSSYMQDFLHMKGLENPLISCNEHPRALHDSDFQSLGRMIALVGDAELDEGNVYECLLESWKLGVRNNWYIIDYNRQSLDKVSEDRSFRQIDRLFRSNEFDVIVVKYGKELQSFFDTSFTSDKTEEEIYVSRLIRKWLNTCENEIYSSLTFQGGAAFKQQILQDYSADSGSGSNLKAYNPGYEEDLSHAELPAKNTAHLTRFFNGQMGQGQGNSMSKFAEYGKDDRALYRLLTNLGGHCMETLIDAFTYASKTDSTKPKAFICYTVKGYGLPIAGHRDNHALFLNDKQMHIMQEAHGIPSNQEWDQFSGFTPAIQHELQHFINNEIPFNQLRLKRDLNSLTETDKINPRNLEAIAPKFKIPPVFPCKITKQMSTQQAFGQVLMELSKYKLNDKNNKRVSLSEEEMEFINRIVTMAPDVTTSTNLSGFLNQKGIFTNNNNISKHKGKDQAKERKIMSVNKWDYDAMGQHIELGIAENNLFLLLAAAGLTDRLFGHRLFPIGTVYDPFIARGLDALNYGCYMDSRFLLVATPSGITLGPEGGAHQSINTPLIGMGQPGLLYYEPATADETAILLREAMDRMQRKASEGGTSVYLRLSTRPLEQPMERKIDASLQKDIIEGGYYHVEPNENTKVCIVYMGAIQPEATKAYHQITGEGIDENCALLQVTSPDILYHDWQKATTTKRNKISNNNNNEHKYIHRNRSHIQNMFDKLPADSVVLTVLDGHPSTLSWLAGVKKGLAIRSLGVSEFGQTGDLVDLYSHYQIDTQNIVDNVVMELKSVEAEESHEAEERLKASVA